VLFRFKKWTGQRLRKVSAIYIDRMLCIGNNIRPIPRPLCRSTILHVSQQPAGIARIPRQEHWVRL